MRILNIIQKPQLRGAEIFACQLSNHLNKQGHEVTVVTIYEGSANLPFLGSVIHLRRPIARRFFDVKGWRELSAVVKQVNPDIVQANAADTLKFAVISKVITGWKAQIVFRNANKVSDFLNSTVKKAFNKLLLSKVSYVISVSFECEKDFIKTFDFSKEKISTVQIGVEEKVVGGIPQDLIPIFKRQNSPVLVHIGGFVDEKNHKGLLQIFEKVKKTYPEVQLLLIGKGKLEEEVRKQVKKKSMGSQVHFLGNRNDVLEIIKYSQVFILPSLIEGLPAVILEAMYCKTSVVAYDVGGISEVINDHTGDLIKKNNEDKFVQAIIRVLQSGDDAKIEEAYRKVLKDYRNEYIASKFAKVYQKLLE